MARENSRTRIRIYQVLLAVGFVLLWESLVRAGLLDEFFFPKPTSTLMRIGEWFARRDIYGHLGITFAESLLAFVIGTFAGIGIGLWLALTPRMLEVLEPFIKASNAIPRIVLAPIFTLWLGLGIASKVALGVTLVFFLAFFNTYQGIREVNPVILANARMLGASWRHLLRHVYLPSAAGWIISSLRSSIGFAVVGAVVGEYLGAASGIGYVIAQAEGLFDTTGVFAGMAVLVAFVLVLDAGITLIERRVLVWRPALSGTGETV
ncbi:MAG TPA: ABC transporter permease [Blastocatellia bacterium]|nr:ABC transporter permease [Blastocatellia bacterium]